MMQIWILTFNRPQALNRLVSHFGQLGYQSNIFSNHPRVEIANQNKDYLGNVIINTLNSPESNSWCARSWNTILMKTFDGEDDEAVLIQDDTDISGTFGSWLEWNKRQYDFIWGPAGDQFHFIRKKVFQKVGWWDERYIGCYCGDAEYVKRVYMEYDRDKISVSDSHNWGFVHNPCDLEENVITTYQSKTVDPDYDNQHWEFERVHGGTTTSEVNPTILNSQQHFRNKWGIDLDNGQPVINSLERKAPEIDWYPWFSKKHGVTTHALHST